MILGGKKILKQEKAMRRIYYKKKIWNPEDFLNSLNSQNLTWT